MSTRANVSAIALAAALAVTGPARAADTTPAGQMPATSTPTAPTPTAPTPADPDVAAVKQASALIVAKQPQQALDALMPTLSRLEQRQAAIAAKGQAVFCASEMSEVIIYTTLAAGRKQSAVVLGPAPCEALFLTAYSLTDLGRKAEALTSLERLVELAPMHAHFYVELGYAYREAGRTDESRAAYEHAVEYATYASSPQQVKIDRAAARRGLGYLLVDAGDLDGAERAYRQSQQDDPDSPIAKSELEFIAKHRAK